MIHMLQKFGIPIQVQYEFPHILISVMKIQRIYILNVVWKVWTILQVILILQLLMVKSFSCKHGVGASNMGWVIFSWGKWLLHLHIVVYKTVSWKCHALCVIISSYVCNKDNASCDCVTYEHMLLVADHTVLFCIFGIWCSDKG